MKNFFLICFSFFILSSFSQNGWAGYVTPVVPNLVGNETCIAMDKYGNKWIGFSNANVNASAGVAKYHKAGGYWTYYSSTNAPAFPNNRVNAIACDTLGNVWIGTIGGLVKYDGTLFTSYTTSNGLPANNVLALACVGNMLYIGTAGGGLTRFDGSAFHNYNTTNGLLCNDTVNCIGVESPTKLWLGVNGLLVDFSINSNYSFSNYNILTNLSKINCIYIDQNNVKWIGTFYSGIVCYDNTYLTNATTTYSNILGAWTPSASVVSIVKGPNNGVLVSSSAPQNNIYVGGGQPCLLELLPDAKYKVYYIPNSNYILGNYLVNDNNEVFMTHRGTVNTGGILRLMYSFKQGQYDGFGQGPGGGVNNDNFKFLDINRVRAGIANRGDMHWDMGKTGNASYEVPSGSGAHGAFLSALWIAGLDASNQLHVAAQAYRQTGSDFWPGPLDTTNASIDTATCKAYDKIWKVSNADINDFILNFTNGNVANNTYTPTADIISWPAKGTGNNSKNLAPFVDKNQNGIYDPLTGGDYPAIKGDQTLYSIFNDKLTAHGESNGVPMGLEVHSMAYAYGCDSLLNGRNELAYTTFYNYKLYNRSTTNYHDVFMGMLAESDLGYYNDDFIGSSPQNNLGFGYNGDNYDEIGYNNYPPASGYIILKGPKAKTNDGVDNNNDGNIDEPGEECLLNKFTYYNNNVPAYQPQTTNPSLPQHYYNYLSGKWKDNSIFSCGGDGYGGTTPTSFMYPWSYYSSIQCPLWGDGTIPKGDRRYIVSSGPFDLNSNEMLEYEFAIAWAVDSSTTGNNLGAVNKLINDAQKISAFYKNPIPSPCMPAVGIKESEKDQVQFDLYPNPASSELNVRSKSKEITTIEIRDVLGKTLLKEKLNFESQYSIDVTSLRGGIYFISINAEKKQTIKKFVKQ